MAGETTELELDMNVEPASMLRAVEKRRQATTGVVERTGKTGPPHNYLVNATNFVLTTSADRRADERAGGGGGHEQHSYPQ